MRRRVRIAIDDIQPQSKNMSGADRDRFQTAIAKQLSSLKRSTFRGDLALKLDVATSSKNPPHAHTIAKSFLDLFGLRRSGVAWPRRHLLYSDDKQIQVLSVSCRHGEDQPDIRVDVRPFAAMLDDLELAAEVIRAAELDDPASYYRGDDEKEWR